MTSLPFYINGSTIGRAYTYSVSVAKNVGQFLISYTPTKTEAVDIFVGPGFPSDFDKPNNLFDTYLAVVDKVSRTVIAQDDSAGTDIWDNPYLRITLTAGKEYIIVASGVGSNGWLKVAITRPPPVYTPPGIITSLPQTYIGNTQGSPSLFSITGINAPAVSFTILYFTDVTIDIYAGGVDSYPDSLQDNRLYVTNFVTGAILFSDNSCGTDGLGSSYIRATLKALTPYRIIVSGVPNLDLGNGYIPPPTFGAFRLRVLVSNGYAPGPYCA